jgi:hypothetical protein
MITIEEMLHLEWIFNRLLYKHKEDPTYVDKAKNILKKIKSPKINITNNNLDKILSIYFIDFNLDKENNIGYTEEERQRLRLSIKSIIQDVLINNIPKNNQILFK